MEKFQVVRKGWKYDTIISEFDSVEDARAFREQQPSNRNLYVRPVDKQGTEQYNTRVVDLKRKVKYKRGTKRLAKYFLICYDTLQLVGEYNSEDAALGAKKTTSVDARLISSPEDIEATFTFDQRVDLYRNLGGTSKVLTRNELHHLIFKLLDKEYKMAAKKATAKSKVTKKGKGKATKKATKAKGNGVKRTGVCAQVHSICDDLYKRNPEAPRADYISACVKKGINKATASTQYQKWKVENFG